MPGRAPAASLYRGCARAERDITGLCCPVELSSVLRTSFERTDKELLAHLEGAARSPMLVTGGAASGQGHASSVMCTGAACSVRAALSLPSTGSGTAMDRARRGSDTSLGLAARVGWRRGCARHYERSTHQGASRQAGAARALATRRSTGCWRPAAMQLVARSAVQGRDSGHSLRRCLRTACGKGEQGGSQHAPRRLRAACGQGEEGNSGATATVALVRRDKIVVANVGDSRAVVSRRRARARRRRRPPPQHAPSTRGSRCMVYVLWL